MKTAILFVAVFVVWVVLIGIASLLLPRKQQGWERMEDMMNQGCQTSLILGGLGFVSVVIVFTCAIVFEFL